MPKPTERASNLLHYRHDALDRLSTFTTLSAEPVQRFYDSQSLRTEVRALHSTSIFRQGDHVLGLRETERTRLLASDAHHSPLIEQDAGQLRSRAYSPYGHCPSDTERLPGFNGEPIEQVTGHYLLGKGYRAYSSVLMRFTSPDSASPFGAGGLNSFAYVLGDPVNHSDPSGRFAVRAITKMFKSFFAGRKARRYAAEGIGLKDVPEKQLKELVQSPRFRPQGRPGPLPAPPGNARLHPHFSFPQPFYGEAPRFHVYTPPIAPMAPSRNVLPHMFTQDSAFTPVVPRRIFGTKESAVFPIVPRRVFGTNSGPRVSAASAPPLGITRNPGRNLGTQSTVTQIRKSVTFGETQWSD